MPQGLLIPKFHKNYWLGLQYNSSSSSAPWAWIDQYIPAPSTATYAAWGVLQDPPALVDEPNNYLGNETCAVGNYSQATGSPANWGWADWGCNTSFINICRMQSG